MKLKINKACDLNSISVLPPHSRRPNVTSSGLDSSGLGKSQASQFRSQSQQSFSQGMPLSQLSQSSFEENLVNDQRFDCQERDKSLKRISSMAPITATRDESQLQLSRTSNNVLRRWSSAPVPDNKCQVTEELEHRFRLMETSLNRLVMILDSVQSDVMQVNRAVKEVSLETEGVRQKMALLDNSVQQVLKEEEGIKAFLDASLKSIPNQIIEPDQSKLNEIASKVSALPEQIEAHLSKFQHEVRMIVARRIEVMANDMKSMNNRYLDLVQSPKSQCYSAARQSQKSQIPQIQIPPSGHTRRVQVPKIEAENAKVLKPKLTGSKHSTILKIEAENPKVLKPKLTGSKHSTTLKQEEIPFASQVKDFRIVIGSDEESDGGLSRLLGKKETGRANFLINEAEKETIRILRKARKRKRRQNNFVILD